MKLYSLTLLFLLLNCPLFSQSDNTLCPPSEINGTHIVQRGETLYGISKKYKVSVEQLRQWNNLNENNILQVCTSLSIQASMANVPSSYGYVSGKSVKPTTTNTSSQNKAHIVAEGESWASIARKYGYTVERLLLMNNMTGKETLYIDQEVIINDCDIATSQAERKNIPQSYTYTGEKNVDNSAAMNETTHSNIAYNWNSNYGRVIHVVSQDQLSQKETPESIGALYGLSGEEVRAMNGLNANTILQSGQRLNIEDRAHTIQRTTYNSVMPPSSDIPIQYNEIRQPQIPTNVPSANTPVTNIPANSPIVTNNTSMSSEEMQMVDEVNLVRYNPEGYIPFIEDYIAELKSRNDMSNATKSAKELIAELKNTPKLSVLQTLPCLYTAAKKHGDDQRRKGDTDHQGSDGSWPWDRVTRECKDLKDGNENLVGGPSDIRRAVILLLVDDGIEGRGHRKTMLQPDWQYVVCHKMGTVGTMPNCWIQLFGN
jgi:LysM repeat protein